ncbi:hypothetical protein GCM10010339_84100 [Streptomyces alanosinicus]|uniref:Uncharacterized protein n=1 Tax=Streptomyces alanosinicus TaxID=68171 RepID=A0A918YUC6_9ACTN|nr:hypothetical protein GCM10010339_84100 [Streptomyces alanosinicus]
MMDRNGHSRLRIPRTVPHPADPGHKPGSGVNNLKDPVETKLHTAVCSGKVTLKAAQQAIVSDWTTALSSLGLGGRPPGPLSVRPGPGDLLLFRHVPCGSVPSRGAAAVRVIRGVPTTTRPWDCLTGPVTRPRDTP